LAIRCYKNWGPCFGFGELIVAYEPFNEPNACWSNANRDNYKIPVNDEGINMLTNKKSLKGLDGEEESKFTIKEIEVWGVTFLE
jgi:hypothetical protein